MDLDEDEALAIAYLQKKFNPKQIITLSAKFDRMGAGTQHELGVVLVSGRLENQDGTRQNFEVTLARVNKEILSWKKW